MIFIINIKVNLINPFLYGHLGCFWWFRWYRICLQYRRLKFDPWVRKIPWKRAWQLTPVFLPGEFSGQRSLEGYILSMGS